MHYELCSVYGVNQSVVNKHLCWCMEDVKHLLLCTYKQVDSDILLFFFEIVICKNCSEKFNQKGDLQ